ncbi:hypothetical protein [Panacagrimonas sp.]|uniref:hypothetical protein n=1 Tax=Panacagrimonas sp. TaxID=2480088 RepID=UPI003B517DD6
MTLTERAQRILDLRDDQNLYWLQDPHALTAEMADLIRELLAENERLQARVDALMLEHCPDEMTPEQVAEWGESQATERTTDRGRD